MFASRATYRPNIGIGQSVAVDRVEPGRLWLSGIDLLDGTPVLDIKPYVPYADQVPDAFNRIATAGGGTRNGATAPWTRPRCMRSAWASRWWS